MVTLIDKPKFLLKTATACATTQYPLMTIVQNPCGQQIKISLLEKQHRQTIVNWLKVCKFSNAWNGFGYENNDFLYLYLINMVKNVL